MRALAVVIVVSSFLGLLFLFALIKILNKLWWTPARIQKLMASHGIKGPPYRFIHGSTKEISTIKSEAMSTPMLLSHDIFPVVQPHIDSWINKYGNKVFLAIYGSMEHVSLIYRNNFWFPQQERIIFSGMVLKLNWSSPNQS